MTKILFWKSSGKNRSSSSKRERRCLLLEVKIFRSARAAQLRSLSQSMRILKLIRCLRVPTQRLSRFRTHSRFKVSIKKSNRTKIIHKSMITRVLFKVLSLNPRFSSKFKMKSRAPQALCREHRCSPETR